MSRSKSKNFEITGVLAFDDEFHESFEELANKFVPVLSESEYLATSLSLMGLIGSVNSIKLGIYDLAEECYTHLYVIKILHRTLIEHYLKFYYVLFRFLKEKNNDVGIEYRKYSKISETLAYINAADVSKSMVGTSTENQVLKKLKKENPELKISKKQLNDITVKWKHRNIISFLKNNTGLIQGEDSYFLKLIPEYAELSSFVHGGTFAEEYYHKVFDSGELKKEIYKEVAESCFIAASIKVHLMLAVVEIDSSFLEGMLTLAKKVSYFIDTYPFHPDAFK